MKFPFACSCRYVNHFEWSQIGMQITCEGCGRSLTVPAPKDVLEEAPPPPRNLKFRCPTCQRKFSTKPGLAGQKIRCSGCGAGVRVPWADEASDLMSPGPGVDSFYSSGELIKAPSTPGMEPVHPDIPRHDATRASTAPPADRPRAAAPPGPDLDAISGLDSKRRRRRDPEPVLPSRSAMLEVARLKAAEDQVVESTLVEAPGGRKRTGKGKGKLKRKKKYSSFFDPKETLKLVAGVGAFVAVLAFLAWGYPEMRFPLGGFLCVVGFIVYLLGAVSLRQLVAEEGMFKLLLYRFCPPYQWWFIFSRWQDSKDFFAFFLAGAMVMSLGGAIIKVSPTGKKAEESERAYQKMIKGRQAEAPPPAKGFLPLPANDDD